MVWGVQRMGLGCAVHGSGVHDALGLGVQCVGPGCAV